MEREGRRVAAIVHDASLETSRELVQAAAAASSILAIDNERLKADLRARLEELRVSRLRIVEAADAARRRIERDLHDGAQQRLVALALDLRMLKARLKGQPEAQAMVDEISSRLHERAGRAARARPRHPSRRCSPTAAWRPPSARSPTAPPSRSSWRSPRGWRSGCRRRSRPPRTSWWPRR